MSNTFAPEHPSVNLVDLPTSMLHKANTQSHTTQRYLASSPFLSFSLPSSYTPLPFHILTFILFYLLLFFSSLSLLLSFSILLPLYHSLLPFLNTLFLFFFPPSLHFSSYLHFITYFYNLHPPITLYLNTSSPPRYSPSARSCQPEALVNAYSHWFSQSLVDPVNGYLFFYLFTTSATASPPPRQREARAFRASRRSIS